MNHFMLENLSHVNIYWLSRVLFYKFLFCLNLYFYLYIYLFVKSCDFVVTVCIYGTKYSRMDQVNFLETAFKNFEEIWSDWSVNVTKSAGNCGFGHICGRNP